MFCVPEVPWVYSDQVAKSYFKFKYNLAIATWCRIFPPLDSKNPIRQVAVIWLPARWELQAGNESCTLAREGNVTK